MKKEKTDILEQANKRYDACVAADNENFTNTRADLKFLNGEHWPEDSKKLRKAERRPCLTINKLPAFVRQITNDQRQNRPSIHVHPVDDDADRDVANILEGMIRHIEYDSDAATCYDTAVHLATAAGRGFFRLITDYESPDSFDQVIKFDRIRNACSVHIDPSSKCPAGSDARFCFVDSTESVSTIAEEYPSSSYATAANDDDKDLLITEYYCVHETPDELLLLSNGETGLRSDLIELPPGVTVLKSRKTARKEIKWYKLAGQGYVDSGVSRTRTRQQKLSEVLEETTLPFDWIPVFQVIGNELDIDGEVTYSGIVRDAKDSSLMYDYWMTSATEEVSMRPKTPYIGAEGAFAGHEEEWRQANVRTFSYLEYKPKTVNGTLAPPPSRQPMADVPSGVLQMAMHASDEIKQTTGVYDASLGARGNETSGKAIQSRKRQGDLSNFHYTDNLNKTLIHAGRVLISGVRRVYSGPRMVRTIGKDETPGFEKINQPQREVIEQPDGQIAVAEKIINDVTVGKYDVIVKAGPSYSTLREESLDAMIEVGQSWPKLMDVAGDKVIEAMDWPDAEQIAGRIKRTMPAALVADDDSAESQLPEQTKQLIQQAGDKIEELQQALQQALAELEKLQSNAALELEKERIRAENRLDVEEVKGWIASQLQAIRAPVLAAEAQQAIRKDDTARQVSQSAENAPNGTLE